MTILIVLAGAAFSFIGTLVGLGGGVFMVPLLVLAVGYPLPMAVGSVALALFPSALISTISNSRTKSIDYKTGIPPATKDIALSISPQLTLEALIAEQAGFSRIQKTSITVTDLLYIRLTGGDEAGEIRPVKGDIAALAAAAKIGVEALISAFDKQETAYICCPWPEKAPGYNDYAHFSRIKEWQDKR